MGRPRKRRRENPSSIDDPTTGLNKNQATTSNPVGSATTESQLPPQEEYLNALGNAEAPNFGDSFTSDHPVHGLFAFQVGDGGTIASLEDFLPNGDVAQTAKPFSGIPSEQNQADFVFGSDHSNLLLPDIRTTSTTSDAGCSCLTNLYSTLSSFQKLPPPSFPYSMGVLTKATTVARDALHCQQCPTVYATALQNLMSLCTLLPLLAHEYGKLLTHIDERAAQGATMSFKMGENSLDQIHLHSGTLDCPMSFDIDLSAAEWRVMARRVVRQKVVRSSGADQSVLELLEELENRQRSWHAKPRLAEFRHGLSCMEQDCAIDEKHTCLQLVFKAKAAIEGLHLDEDSIQS